MSVYIFPIKIAFITFSLLGFLLVLPWFIYSYRKYGFLSPWASLVTYSFSFYMLAALFLVLLPLPNTRDTCSLQSPGTVHYSLIPFSFISDIIKNSSVVWSEPSTYTQMLKHGAFWQAAFNFLLLLPFGVYLRYFFQEKRYWKRAFGLGLALSLFYEITQLTGIYGIYNCPYRIFDVDDLFLNSTGALFGFLVAPILLALFPSQKSLAAKAEKIQHSSLVPPLSQLIAIYIDYLFIKFSWSLIARFFSTNEFFEFFYFTIGFVILYFLVPLFGKGKTIGTNIMRFKLVDFHGETPSWKSLFNRFFALYFPWLISWSLSLLNSVELDINSNIYPYQVWITVATFAFNVIMWIVLFIHILFILLKRGKRNFYFDHVSKLIPVRK